MNNTRPKAFIVTNIDVFFLTNRKEQAQIMQERGFEIHVLAADTGRSEEIRQLGFVFHALPMGRFGLGPLQVLKNIWQISNIYKQEAPAVIHQLGLKIIMLGTLAGLRTKAVIFNTYTGLGYLFTIDNYKTKILRRLLLLLSKWIYKNKRVIAIFQNTTDYKLFEHYGIVDQTNGYVIKGCGVKLTDFDFTPLPAGDVLRILLPGKMLSSKGVYEFVEIAKNVKADKTIKQQVEFQLCGGIDEGHPFAIKKEEIEKWQENGWVKWLGNQRKMSDVYKQADIVILPSWREGLPKSLLEAGAVGRPIITYNVAGCSEVVVDGVTGYVVPFGDVSKMTEYTKQLINDKTLRDKMGANSCNYIKEHFELYKIIDENMKLYSNNKLI